MEVTEVRIKLMDEAGDRLQAFCSITFDDCFVIRDLKIIEGTNGPFVAMPSRKLTARCPQCGCKNHLRAAHCNQCGLRLKDDRAIKDESGRTKLYADIAHPINSRCREAIQDRIIQAYREELERAKLPGYVSSYDDFDEGEDFTWHEDAPAGAPTGPHTKVECATSGRQKPARVSSGPQPRGPHKPASQPPAREMRDNDSFGAGIL